MSDTRQHVHELVDRLPAVQLDALAGLLESMVGAEREEPGDQEERAVDEAKEWLRANGGRGIPHEEVLADFGLSVEDFQRMGEDRARRRRA